MRNTSRSLTPTGQRQHIPAFSGHFSIDADRFSASYLIALGARIVREVSDLLRRSKEIDKRLPTLALDTEIRFRSAADRAAFSSALTDAVTQLVSRYHDESARGGRTHRLVIVAHPLSSQSPNKERL